VGAGRHTSPMATTITRAIFSLPSSPPLPLGPVLGMVPLERHDHLEGRLLLLGQLDADGVVSAGVWDLQAAAVGLVLKQTGVKAAQRVQIEMLDKESNKSKEN